MNQPSPRPKSEALTLRLLPRSSNRLLDPVYTRLRPPPMKSPSSLTIRYRNGHAW